MSDTAIVSEQSGETRSRGSALHFREAKSRGKMYSEKRLKLTESLPVKATTAITMQSDTI